MVNFASKHDFKQATKKIMKPQKQKHSDVIQDDDTLMSAEDMRDASSEDLMKERPSNFFSSHPINIQGSHESGFVACNIVNDGREFSRIDKPHLKQNIESEMSGETSNQSREVREIRAGCRRVREDSYRPGYAIGFNEDLLK